jgi:hypothetical protein
MSKYEASDMLLMLIESAQSKHRETNPDIPILGITDTQSQDPEFKKILTQQFADTPTNVVDYQDTGVGGRPFEIEGGVPVDESGNPIKSVGAADLLK